MIVTFNEKEIRNMILDGLRKMGIDPKEAKVTMIAGRSPNGMTAEVTLNTDTKQAIPTGAIPREGVVGNHGPGPGPTGTEEPTEEELNNSPVAEEKEPETKTDSDEPKPTTPLFEK